MARLNACADPEGGPGVATPPAPSEPTSFTVAERVLAAAANEWRRVVREPSPRIDDYIRSAQGLGWPSAEVGVDARPNIPYSKNGQFEWCGAFAAFAYGAAGLRPEVRRKHLASTYRLYRWARGSGRWLPPNPEAFTPGDIAVIGPEGDADGAHVTLVERVIPASHGSGASIATIEGNARGRLGDGSVGEGVIRADRSFPYRGIAQRTYRVIFGVRPLREDFE